MLILKSIFSSILLTGLFSCMHEQNEQIAALKALLCKEKFNEELPAYTGVKDEKIKGILNRAINISIEGFIDAIENKVGYLFKSVLSNN